MDEEAWEDRARDRAQASQAPASNHNYKIIITQVISVITQVISTITKPPRIIT